MGEVWRARDPRLGRDVALKVLPDDMSRDTGRIARFHAEARAASALNHPNIVTVYDIGEDAGRTYLSMELLEGINLQTASRRRQAAPSEGAPDRDARSPTAWPPRTREASSTGT